MVVIEVKEIHYSKDTSACLASDENDNSLVSSIEFDNDELFEKKKQEIFFKNDMLIKFFKVTSDGSKNSNNIVQTLKDFSISDPDELRYWFKDIPIGKYELLTSWEIIESEDILALIYDGWTNIKKD